MNCESVREQLLELNDGRLNADAAAVVRAHLTTCPECRHELETIQQLLADLDANPAAPALPKTPDRFGRLGDLKAKKPAAGTRAAVRIFGWPLLVRAIAACGLLVIGFFVGMRWTSSHGTDSSSARAVNELVVSLATDPSANVRMNAVEALFAHTDQEAARIGVLISLPHEQSPMVEVAMIDFLVAAKDREALPVLERISGSDTVDSNVREAARRALPKL